MAAIVGVDPFPYSLRELDWMHRAKRIEAWDHTSHLLAMLVNVNMTKGRRPKPIDYHPLAQQIKQDRPKKQLNKKQSRDLLNQLFGVKDAGNQRP